MPKDSLAGVALRYGVSLPDLRRANQLWPSDPIHLRRVLYIPLEKARHSKELQDALLHVNTDASGDSSLADSEETETEPNRAAIGDRGDRSRNQLTITRVPASQLSYFPPPASSVANGKSYTLPRNSTAIKERPPLPLFSPPRTSTAQQVLSSSSSLVSPQRRGLGALLNALPIRVASSSRVTFRGRSSIDSISATPSTQSDELEWEHEMENVSAASSVGKGGELEDVHTQYQSHTRSPSSSATSRGSRPLLEASELDHTFTSVPRTPQRRGKHQVERDNGSSTVSASYQPSTPYTSPERLRSPSVQATVRTAQLEPSPVMQLPLTSKSPRSRDS